MMSEQDEQIADNENARAIPFSGNGDIVSTREPRESDSIGVTDPSTSIGSVVFTHIENEVKQVHRIVCASWGQPGHHEHSYVKGNYDLCVKYAAKLTQRTKGKELEWEVPFRIQTRVVSEWEYVPER
jgi:hypothetical protein